MTQPVIVEIESDPLAPARGILCGLIGAAVLIAFGILAVIAPEAAGAVVLAAVTVVSAVTAPDWWRL